MRLFPSRVVLGILMLTMLLVGPMAGQGIAQNVRMPDSPGKRVPQWQDSSIRALLSQEPETAVGVLRQTATLHSSAWLDELADSMVALALRGGRQFGTRGGGTAWEVVIALRRASSPYERQGLPYAGGVDRLMRLYELVPQYDSIIDPWAVRDFALRGIADSGPTEQIVEFLLRVAISADYEAADAMGRLLNYLEPDGYMGAETGPYRRGTPALRVALEARLRAMAVVFHREQTEALARIRQSGGEWVPSNPDEEARKMLLGHALWKKWDLGGP